MRQIVVTGGGTGIGYAVAAAFVRAGEQVTITGRREHVLKEAVAGLAGLVSAAGPGAPAAGYAWVALVLHSGGRGGLMLQLALVVTGAALALGFSPLVTHALVRVPLPQAADASGLLTTTIQLGQAIGVATFGSLFLTLDSARGPVVSGHALAVTFGWLAAVMVLGAAAGIPLARTVAAARAQAA